MSLERRLERQQAAAPALAARVAEWLLPVSGSERVLDAEEIYAIAKTMVG